MYEMYIDESGNPAPTIESHEGNYFILIGIIINEKDAKAARIRVKDLNRTVCAAAAGSVPEFHASNIWNGKGFFDRQAHPIPLAIKRDLFRKMANLIAHPDVSVIDVIVDKARYTGQRRDHVIRMAWSALFDRFDRFLNERPGGPGWGVMIADKNNAGIRSLIADVVSKKSKKCCGQHPLCMGVVDDVRFRSSHEDEGIQMADGAAFMINRYLRGDDTFKAQCDRMRSRRVSKYVECQEWPERRQLQSRYAGMTQPASAGLRHP